MARFKRTLWFLALVAAGFAIGIQAGRRFAPGAASGKSAEPYGQPSTRQLARHRAARPENPGVEDHARPSSLAEIQAAITEARRDPRKFRALEPLLGTVAPADIPQVLGEIDQLPSAGVRERLRTEVLSRWAAIDTPAALT